MSIWGSVGDRPVYGLDYDDDDGHGDPCINVGVATTWHDHARLSVYGDDGIKAANVDATVLLPPEELRILAARLIQAAESCERMRAKYGDLSWQAQAERHWNHLAQVEADRQDYLARAAANIAARHA